MGKGYQGNGRYVDRGVGLFTRYLHSVRCPLLFGGLSRSFLFGFAVNWFARGRWIQGYRSALHWGTRHVDEAWVSGLLSL